MVCRYTVGGLEEGGEHVVAHLELVDEHGTERGRRAEERAVDHLVSSK